ncbi:T9SS type A sorting domain-containing protein [Bernardetia sp. OM2101]|uniref:T9SS type A sorting domain-containing protein n=1 Tax=Bernardetia sp. OM2101 TaxID=3344876 RepID=UPI0035CF7C15
MKEKSYFRFITLGCFVLFLLTASFEVFGQCGGDCTTSVTGSVTWPPTPTAGVVCVDDALTITLTADVTIDGFRICQGTGGSPHNVTINGDFSLTINGDLEVNNNSTLTINDASLVVNGDLDISNNGGNIDINGDGDLLVEGCFSGSGGAGQVTGDLTWCVVCPGDPSDAGAGSPTDCETLRNPILCNGYRIPGEPACTTCTSTINSSTGGLNINAGDVVCVQGGTVGSPVSLTNINLNGGELQICSGFVQGNLNFGSGTLNVLTGSSFDITNSFDMNGNAEINVYGTLDMSGSYNMQNGNNTINTSTGSVLSINSLSMNGTAANPGHTLNVLGQVDITTLTVNSGNNSVSVESNGNLNVGILAANNEDNSFCTNTCGGFTINNSAQINNPISDDSELLFCYQGGSFISGSSGQPLGGGDGSYAGSATEGCPANCNNLLPVFLTFFNIESKESDVVLRWETSSEYNNSHFFIERSSKGDDFQIIGSVAGQGTTNKAQNYEWTDPAPLDGGTYYRLRQVDSDGNYSISMVRYKKHYYSQEEVELYVYPNPVQDHLTIVLNTKLQQVKFELVDLFGNVITTKNVTEFSGGSVVWDGLGDLKGFYVLRVYHQEFVQQRKILFR